MDKKDGASIEYWRKNRILIAVLLFVWALVSYVFAIFMANSMYNIKIGHLPFSFWWAQQGSMFVFVLLILVYCLAMDKLDRQYDVHEEDEKGGRG